MINISKYPKVKSLKTMYMGRGVFQSKYAVITAQNGKEYYYTFALSESWNDEADWLDNVCYDFQNEYDENDLEFGMRDMELFDLVDDEARQYLYD